jgi:sensor histidine kinase regulating citrate/malate metabolism
MIIFDSIAEGVFTVDLNWRITSFNRAAGKNYRGFQEKRPSAGPARQVFNTNICLSNCALRNALEKKQPVFNLPVYMSRSDSRRIPVVRQCDGFAGS